MLWLIGGTSESAAIAQALDAHNLPYCVTVTTENARLLYSDQTQVVVGAIAAEAMSRFIQTYQIQKVVDASHPFAVEVSRGAIAAAQSCNVDYLRFERPERLEGHDCDCVDRTQTTEVRVEAVEANVVRLPSLAAVLQSHWLEGERSLLVLGYRMLAAFLLWQSRAVLYARILPSPVALEKATEAGFSPDRLIALRPPISQELEAALWRQWGITQVIAKASGQAGGEDVKRTVAQELGVRLLLIDRPAMVYPLQTAVLDEVLAFVF